MTILLALLHHERHGTVRIRVQSERDARAYEGYGWRFVGIETRYVRGPHGRD